jgi:hypothetical protein
LFILAGTEQSVAFLWYIDKRLIHSSQKQFDHICNVEAHGDGVSQVAVDSMAFAATTRCLASVAEGKVGVKLWNVDEDGDYPHNPIPIHKT